MVDNYLIRNIMMECPICDKEHEVGERRRSSTITIKGEMIEYEESYFLCKKGDEDENEFVTAKMNDENLMNARNSYRVKKGLLTSDEIVKIREQYGLSQVDLSNLLGWGEVTISRYESKAIQEEAYDTILKTIRDNPLKAYELLNKNKDKFNLTKYSIIRNKIVNNLDEYGREFLKRQVLESDYINFIEPSDFNGNKSLDIDKLESVISYFAKRITNLYKVKLMKMLWYADVLSYKTTGSSMTGMVYRHDDMGALPIGHYKILELENLNVVKKEDYDYTTYHILTNDKLDLSNFDSNELDILDKVINKFKFYSSEDIINYMHNERAYLETKDGQIIPFSLAREIKNF